MGFLVDASFRISGEIVIVGRLLSFRSMGSMAAYSSLSSFAKWAAAEVQI